MSEYDTLATKIITDKKLTIKLGSQKPDSIRKGIYRAIVKLNKLMADHGVNYPTSITTHNNGDGTVTYTLIESKPSSKSLNIEIVEDDLNGNSKALQEILDGPT